MKLRWIVLFTAAWFTAAAIAQDQQPRESGRATRLRQPGADRPGGGSQALLDRIRAELDLDQDQQAEFDRLATQFREKRGRGANREEMRALLDEMREAREQGNDERVTEIRNELRGLRGGSRIAEFLDQIEGILHDDQREKLTQIKTRLASQRERPLRGPGARNPLGQLRRLRRDLNLTEEQAEQFDGLYEQMRAEFKRNSADTEETREFLRKIMEAAEAGDTERVKELREQMPDTRARPSPAVARFLEQIEGFLKPEQLEILERFRKETMAEHNQTDLRACFRFVSRLDLDQQQRQTLREIQKETSQAAREARRDPEAMAELSASVQRELREMLSDDQVAQFDKWLEGRESGKPSRGRSAHRPQRERERRGERGERGGPETP